MISDWNEMILLEGSWNSVPNLGRLVLLFIFFLSQQRTEVHVLCLCVLQRLTAHLHSAKAPPYVINLDPAVHEVPFPANIGEPVCGPQGPG